MMSVDRLTLRQFQDLFATEAACRAWLETARWPHGPVCPRCGAVDRASRRRTRPGKYTCLDCAHDYSLTAGTPMHKTHLPLTVWFTAMYLMATSSKGISAKKLGELLGIQYRTAWHLAHRIRAMMAEDSPVLRGLVEIDETYAGAPPRKKTAGDGSDDDPPPSGRKPGRGTSRPLVLVAAERGGKAHARVIGTHGKSAIAEALGGMIDSDAMALTDGLPAYKHLAKERPHLTVNHSTREYARTDAETGIRVHVNTAESFNSMLHRAVVGVFHWISPKHLDRYAAEAAFHWNAKKTGPLARLAALVENGAGRILPLRRLIGTAA
jgi:transposase-like protein